MDNEIINLLSAFSFTLLGMNLGVLAVAVGLRGAK